MSLKLFIYGENGFINSTLAASLSMIGFDVIGETEDEQVAIHQITHHLPEVVIMSIDLNQIKAIELSKLIRKRFPKIGIVLLSKCADFRFLGISRRDLPIGIVASQMARHGDLDSLKDKIRLAPYSTDSKSDFPINKYFTESQIETMRLLAAGNANSEIAKLRYVSEKSVEQMLARIAIMFGITFDFQHNSRVRILNSYYDLVNGR